MTWQLASFLALLGCFHGVEFVLAALMMRHELGWHSLLFSKPYIIAMAVSMAEYLLESLLLPGIKLQSSFAQAVSLLGLTVALLGECLRKAGMLTARTNFTHTIRTSRDPSHQLITHGIYRYVRHPGYLGWYLWCVGGQLLLVNPLCTAGFACVAWRFFQQRIAYEEYHLRAFFGEAYTRYAQRTPTWFPRMQ